MFTPEYLRDFPDYLVTLVEQYDAFVIQDFSRRVAKAASVTETAAWQAERAQELGLSMEELTKQSAELTKISQSALKQMLEEASDTYLASEQERLGASGLSFERVTNSPVLQNYLAAVYQQTSGQMKNITGTTATGLIIGGKYRSMKDSYLMALDLAQMQVSSGVLDYNTAVRNAIRSISSTGVSTMTNDAVQYDSGYHLSARAAARMCVRTGVNQIAGKYNEFIADYFGLDLVETTAHLGARPSHQEWQGQIFSRSGNSKKYPPLSDTGYGQVDGLMGANCRHNMYAYVDGAPRAYTSKQLYEMSDAGAKTTTYNGRTYTYYEATQKQRQMERQIIKTKRELIGYAATGDTEAYAAASLKLANQRQKYSAFSNAAGLRQHWDRSQQDGYDRSLARKSTATPGYLSYKAWCAKYGSGKKEVEKSGKDGILNETDIRAIQDYMSSGVAYSLNEALRTGDALTTAQEAVVQNLDAALAKLPDYEGTVYRSVSTSMIDDPAAFLAQYQEGALIRFPAYTSTSKAVYDPNMEIQYVITSKRGKDISSINANEREVLFQRQSYFRVTRRDGEKIWMEEV